MAKEVNKGGRPRKEIDEDMFVQLCELHCTKLEICSLLKVSDKTLDKFCVERYGKPFSVIFKEKSAGGKMSLRRMQFKLAENNATMAIWLGKQYLEQRDERSVDVTAEILPVVIKGSDELE